MQIRDWATYMLREYTDPFAGSQSRCLLGILEPSKGAKIKDKQMSRKLKRGKLERCKRIKKSGSLTNRLIWSAHPDHPPTRLRGQRAVLLAQPRRLSIAQTPGSPLPRTRVAAYGQHAVTIDTMRLVNSSWGELK